MTDKWNEDLHRRTPACLWGKPNLAHSEPDAYFAETEDNNPNAKPSNQQRWEASNLTQTVLSLSVMEYFSLVSKPLICDRMVFSSDSFLFFLICSFSSSASFSLRAFSWFSIFSSHRRALAFRSLEQSRLWVSLIVLNAKVYKTYLAPPEMTPDFWKSVPSRDTDCKEKHVPYEDSMAYMEHRMNSCRKPTLCLSCRPKATFLASSTVSHTNALPQAKSKAFLMHGGSYRMTSTTSFTFFGSRISLFTKWIGFKACTILRSTFLIQWSLTAASH